MQTDQTGKISVSAMLAEIDTKNGELEFFSIAFCKAGRDENDQDRGKIKTINQCLKGYKNQEPHTPKPTGESKKTLYRIKEKGILLVFDFEKQQHISIIIDLIIFYNNKIVIR